jgi:hypothetical protein
MMNLRREPFSRRLREDRKTMGLFAYLKNKFQKRRDSRLSAKYEKGPFAKSRAAFADKLEELSNATNP